MIEQEEKTQHKGWRKEDFAIHKPLGNGRFASVYLATEKTSKVQVAIKEIKKKFVLKHEFVHQLRREVEIQNRLKHPNIIRLFGYFQDQNSIYLVQELASSGSLYEHLQKRGKLNLAEVRSLAFQLLSALHYLEERKVMHRDVKLENILLDSNLNPKLSDFGWSVHSVSASRRSFCGTVLYLAPELVDRESYSSKVDIWSTGILIFETATGKPPFFGKDNKETFDLIKTKNLEQLGIEALVECPELRDLLFHVGYS